MDQVKSIYLFGNWPEKNYEMSSVILEFKKWSIGNFGNLAHKNMGKPSRFLDQLKWSNSRLNPKSPWKSPAPISQHPNLYISPFLLFLSPEFPASYITLSWRRNLPQLGLLHIVNFFQFPSLYISPTYKHICVVRVLETTIINLSSHGQPITTHVESKLLPSRSPPSSHGTIAWSRLIQIFCMLARI